MDKFVMVPVEPTEEMWSGLARHLIMWMDFGSPTVKDLRDHLSMVGIAFPDWMEAESEMKGSGVPSKGTRATLVYKAMLADAPAPVFDEAAERAAHKAWYLDHCGVGGAAALIASWQAWAACAKRKAGVL